MDFNHITSQPDFESKLLNFMKSPSRKAFEDIAFPNELKEIDFFNLLEKAPAWSLVPASKFLDDMANDTSLILSDTQKNGLCELQKSISTRLAGNNLARKSIHLKRPQFPQESDEDAVRTPCCKSGCCLGTFLVVAVVVICAVWYLSQN